MFYADRDGIRGVEIPAMQPVGGAPIDLDSLDANDLPIVCASHGVGGLATGSVVDEDPHVELPNDPSLPALYQLAVKNFDAGKLQVQRYNLAFDPSNPSDIALDLVEVSQCNSVPRGADLIIDQEYVYDDRIVTLWRSDYSFVSKKTTTYLSFSGPMVPSPGRTKSAHAETKFDLVHIAQDRKAMNTIDFSLCPGSGMAASLWLGKRPLKKWLEVQDFITGRRRYA